MALTNLKYFLKEGIHSFFRNWTMSLASCVIVTACLLTFGVYLALSTNINNILFSSQNSFENNFYINSETSLNRAREIGIQIEKIPNVANVTLLDKKDELDKMNGQTVGITEDDIPHRYCVQFKNADLAPETTTEIMKISEIYSHLNGFEYIQYHKKHLWTELENIIKSIDARKFRTKVSKEKTMLGDLLYSPIELIIHSKSC